MANIQKTKKAELMTELTKIVENGVIMGVTHEQLAKRFNTRRQTISTYLDKVYATLEPEEIHNTTIKLQTMFDKLFREAQKLLQESKTNKDKKDAMDLLLRMMDKFTDFLERFGIKEKVADKVELKGMVMNLDVSNEATSILDELN